jgi:hypothetical protein
MEDLPGRDEQLRLGRQVRAARLDQVDHREPVTAGDFQGAQRLAQRVGVHRAAADRRVVRDQDTLDPADHADAGDDAGPDGELGAPRGQGGQFEERPVPVQQQLDPLPGQQPAAVVVALLIPGTTAGPGLAQLSGEFIQQDELGVPVGLVFR